MRLLRALRALIVWPVVAALIGALYGVLNDQITVTLSPEYFSVFKREQFAPLIEGAGLGNAPTRLQAVLVGAASTWWFGWLLGVLLALCGVVGRRPFPATRHFLRATLRVILFAALFSLAAGGFGYLYALFLLGPSGGGPPDWPFLEGIRDRRAAFAVGMWHTGAYLGGLIGTFAACRQVLRWRRQTGLSS